MQTQTTLPPIHRRCGLEMRPGTYPYDCPRKDKHPDATVWHDDHCGMWQVDLPSERANPLLRHLIDWRD